MSTLISFLGKQMNGYRETEYELNNQFFTTKFMGADLTQIIKPKKLLLIGTAGSMWDVLFDHYGTTDERLLELIEKSSQNEVDENFLQAFTPELEQKLGCEVRCIVIGYARDSVEQIAILQRISRELCENECISLDVTHGFRHLPMLALVAARFLKSIKNIRTEHIYYGAFEMRNENNRTPVVDLSGMLTMLDWVDALSAYKQSDNYAAFIPLLDSHNGQLLKEAAFFENINQMQFSRSSLKEFNKNLQSNQINNLFLPLVKNDWVQRLQWVKEKGHYERQLYLAKRHLENGNYLQASILGNEAWISKKIKFNNQDQNVHGLRDKAKDELKKTLNSTGKKLFNEISAIRNAMAHGTKPDNADILPILNNQEKLHQKLKDIIQYIETWEI